VGAIAEGLIVALATAAEPEGGSAGEIEWLARGVYDLEVVALDAQ